MSTMPVYAQNRRARFDYHIADVLLAGIVLEGSEVKSIRNRRVSLAGSYCTFFNGELWLRGAHVAAYKPAAQNHEPERDRKLLLTKRQLAMLKAARQQGRHIIPLRLLAKGSFIKLEIGIGKAKKQYDKRQYLRQKDDQKRMQKIQKHAQKGWPRT